MQETLLSVITHYAVSRTKHTAEHFSEWFAEHPDYYINYILRTALPVDFNFDGIKHTYFRLEESDSLQLTCTFWYLTSEGESTSAALRFFAEVEGPEIKYRYSIIPASGFPRYDKTGMDPEEVMNHIVSNHKWPNWTAGVIRP